jgi:asparagine synthetase B (glutamine-hydrolysing)
MNSARAGRWDTAEREATPGLTPTTDFSRGSGGEAGRPDRFPIACGALGRFDPRQTTRVAAALGGELSIAHQDDVSILLCDRPPIRWDRGRNRGLCWSEGIPRNSRVTSWQDAARSLAASGLVLGEDGPRVHTSVAGLAPIYHRKVGEATYFATRIEPLVAAFDERVSIDWGAWASIFLLTAPIGERTPFAEIRRVPPFSLLGHEPGRGPRVEAHDWPWAQPDPVGPRATAETVVEALREVVRSLPAEPLTCPLSGGWDSRLLLALLSERSDLPLSALTLRRLQGGHREEEYARDVASALSVPMRAASARAWTPWRDTTEVAARTDYQTTHHDWFMPLVRGVRKQPGLVADGLCGDVLFAGYLVNEEMLDSRSWGERIRLLWESVSNWRFATELLSDRLAAAFSALAWRHWMEEATPLADHPAHLSLTIYRTRTVRGISLAPVALLGADAGVLTPFTDDRVARAGLGLPMRPKVRHDLYRRLFELVNPTVGALPSTHDPRPKRQAGLGPPQASREAIRHYRRCLRQSPLRSDIDPSLLEAGGNLPSLIASTSRNSHILRALVLLSLWQARYSDKLREIDPGEILA